MAPAARARAALAAVARPAVAPPIGDRDARTRCAAARRSPSCSPATECTDLDLAGLDPRARARPAPAARRAGVQLPLRRPTSSPDARSASGPSPEQRVAVPARRRRLADAWPSRSPGGPRRCAIEGDIDNSLYEALDAQVPDEQLDGADRAAAGLGSGRRLRLAGGLHPRHPAGRPVPGAVRAAGLRGRRGPLRPRARRATSRCRARA